MNKLREIRRRKGLNAIDIARKIGVTPASYYRYEKGEQTLSAEILAKLADAMGVTADQILGREELDEKPQDIQEVDIQKAVKEGKIKLHWGGIPLGEKDIEEIRRILEYILWKRVRGE